jgi:hypothetical protein
MFLIFVLHAFRLKVKVPVFAKTANFQFRFSYTSSKCANIVMEFSISYTFFSSQMEDQGLARILLDINGKLL